MSKRTLPVAVVTSNPVEENSAEPVTESHSPKPFSSKLEDDEILSEFQEFTSRSYKLPFERTPYNPERKGSADHLSATSNSVNTVNTPSSISLTDMIPSTNPSSYQQALNTQTNSLTNSGKQQKAKVSFSNMGMPQNTYQTNLNTLDNMKQNGNSGMADLNSLNALYSQSIASSGGTFSAANQVNPLYSAGEKGLQSPEQVRSTIPVILQWV